MRTTVTLDADVELLLKQRKKQTQQSFKVVLNSAIRDSLGKSMPSARSTFTIDAKPMGLKSGQDPAKLSALADDYEADAFLKNSQRLAGKIKQ